MSAPRLARWLTRLTAPADRLLDILGDLEEVHHRRRTTGAARAWLITICEAALIAAVLTGDRLRPVLSVRQWCSGTDVRLGLRVMRREPIITVTATVALALGIGLLTVGAATVETLLFSRLPFEGGERFVLIRALQEPERRPARLTPEDYGAIATRATALTHLGAASQNRENVTLPSGAVDEANTAGITPTSLMFLPYGPVRGRLLTPADADSGRGASRHDSRSLLAPRVRRSGRHNRRNDRSRRHRPNDRRRGAKRLRVPQPPPGPLGAHQRGIPGGPGRTRGQRAALRHPRPRSLARVGTGATHGNPRTTRATTGSGRSRTP